MWVGSGSGILRFRSWIRIRIKSFRVHNTAKQPIKISETPPPLLRTRTALDNGLVCLQVAMTYSVELFLCMVLGLALGHAVFNSSSPVSSLEKDGRHTANFETPFLHCFLGNRLASSVVIYLLCWYTLVFKNLSKHFVSRLLSASLVPSPLSSLISLSLLRLLCCRLARQWTLVVPLRS